MIVLLKVDMQVEIIKEVFDYKIGDRGVITEINDGFIVIQFDDKFLHLVNERFEKHLQLVGTLKHDKNVCEIEKYDYFYMCPVCEQFEAIMWKEYKFCPYCGSRIYWVGGKMNDRC